MTPSPVEGLGQLGLGAAQLGNLYAPMSDENAAAIVERARALGIRYIDTAPHYGLGLSERRLGAILNSAAADVIVSTKVGRMLDPIDGEPRGDDLANGFAVPAEWTRRWDFSADGVRRSLDESRSRLGRDRIDIVYLHDPDDHMEQALSDALPALVRMRDAGEIGAIGAGMNSVARLRAFVDTGGVDIVLLAGRYTLLEQGEAPALLDAALAQNVAVVIGGIFNSGLLASSVVGDDGRYDYAPAPPGLLQRARRLAATCERHGVALPAAAIQFALRHPAVRCVLVGVMSAAELVADHQAANASIPEELWTELHVEGLLP